MAKLTAYNIKVKIYCSDDNEARAVQSAVNDISGGVDIIGSETLGFYDKFKRNESLIVPAIRDVARNGLKAISRHILILGKIK